jgi:hypothetical protein
MSANSLFANKILTILPSHVMHGAEHHAVVGWSLGVGMHFIESMVGRKSNEEALVALLPNLSKALGTTRDIDTAVCLPLSKVYLNVDIRSVERLHPPFHTSSFTHCIDVHHYCGDPSLPR